MRLIKKYKLGDLITQRREKYDCQKELPIRGVSNDGFINAKQPGADTSLYNTFYLNDFVFNPARMELNSISLNLEFEKAICSSLYEIFYVCRPDIIMPEYLNLFIKRNEFARRCAFIGWGSAREYCRISNISDIEIDVPPIFVQRKYVNIYNAMTANQKSYEKTLDDLKFTLDALIDRIKHTAEMKAAYQLLTEVDNRNSDGAVLEVKGININKRFMPSVANTTGVDLRKYKIVSKNQLAFSGMQTGRDECIRIALHKDDKPIIISPAYTVFEVKGNEILPEYIMIWFSRYQSDRRGWFMSDSSIRSNLDLDRFYETKLPIPCLAVQESIVNLYNAYILRQNINENLKIQLKSICPILIQGSLSEGV